MKLDSVDGRLLVEVCYEDGRDVGYTIGTSGTHHGHNLDFNEIKTKEFDTLTIIRCYINYFGWEEGYLKLCYMGIINDKM